MINREIAKIFYEISQRLETEETSFKSQAYQKAALSLEALSEDVKDTYKRQGINGLKEIPNIGESMAEKIVEYLKTGKIKENQRLKKKMPVNIEELISVEGIGPKMVRDLYRHLKIKNLIDLEKAAKAGKIRSLPNFGLKTEQNILQSIEFLKRSKGRFLLGEILPKVYEIIDALKKVKKAKQIFEAGSIRRRKETIGDVDILITVDETKNPAFAKASADKMIDYFVSLPGVVKIWGKGSTKASIRLKEGFDVDLRVLPEKQFGSALQYFTGSKEHNIILRKIAMNQGLKLNEYGLFRGKKMIAGRNEKEIYAALKMDYIEPELRENKGEIEVALRQIQNKPNQTHDKPNGLPKIIGYSDILGDLHIHSNYNGGENSILEIAEAAINIGYQYIGIADHTKFLRIEHGLDEKQLTIQREEIDKINKKLQASGFKFYILQGCEANIMPDGSIDIKDEALSRLDYVIAGVHHQMKMPKEKMTKRIIKAINNPNVDIISHPTGRILKRRDEYEVDFNEILKATKKTGTILEINANPYRLDLNDSYIKKAKEFGVKMVINTDAHRKEQLNFMKYGISQARRGWAERKDIINCWPAEEMKNFLKDSKSRA
ncbi:MAG: DNA polymerase/3'-5' exonuclease PolX [Candidatus Liptonbacteria bacterium]|nr:DNA polymerase/3'-5' exonuclease PolX [Candidatus Liptonbacteria bacterium]